MTATPVSLDKQPQHHDGVHITPLRTYLLVWGSLMVLTGITVAVSLVDFGSANLFVAILIASVKAALVALYFMHLRHDNKFNLVILVTSLLFVALFLFPTVTEVMTRGDLDPRLNQDRFERRNCPDKGEKPHAAMPAHG